MKEPNVAISPPDTPNTALAHAAALLDAIARDSEHAVDFDIPLSCGLAASRLHAAIGYVPTDIPDVGDDITRIRAALSDALQLLRSLPPHLTTGNVWQAFSAARDARQSLPPEPAP
jgi:hypothetical protein